MIGDAIDRWAAAIDAGQRPVMLAGSNDVVDRLNRAAIDAAAGTWRARRPATPCTAAPATTSVTGSRCDATAKANAPSTAALVDVANGQLGTVVAVDGRRLVVRLDRAPDVDVVLDDRYLARGGQISHGYALTTHRAQGGTWDLSITVGVDGLYREAAYTDLSRGIAENWLVITDPDLTRLTTEADPDLDRHDTGIDPDAGVDDRRRPHTTAVDLTRPSSSPTASTPTTPASTPSPVAGRCRTSTSNSASPDKPPASPPSSTASTATSSSSRLATLDHTARHAAIGRRGSRPSTGTTSAPSSTSTTVPAPSTSGSSPPTARPPSATCPGNTSSILDAAAPRDLPADAADTLQRTRSAMEQQLQAWTDTVIALGSDVDEVPILQRAVDRHVAIGVDQLTATEPDWLHHLIGPRPADPIGAHSWDDVVGRHRPLARANTTSPATASAPRPTIPTPPGDATPSAPAAPPPGPGSPTPTGTNRTGRSCAATANSSNATTSSTPSSTPHQPTPAHVIDAARNGQLALTDVDEIIRQAGDTRHARQHWILEHWPHVVEYAEIDTTLRQPDLGTRPRRSVRRHRPPTPQRATSPPPSTATSRGSAPPSSPSTPTTTPPSTTTRSTGSTTSPSTAPPTTSPAATRSGRYPSTTTSVTSTTPSSSNSTTPAPASRPTRRISASSCKRRRRRRHTFGAAMTASPLRPGLRQRRGVPADRAAPRSRPLARARRGVVNRVGYPAIEGAPAGAFVPRYSDDVGLDRRTHSSHVVST